MPIYGNPKTMLTQGRQITINESSGSKVNTSINFSDLYSSGSVVTKVTPTIDDSYFRINQNEQHICVSSSLVYTQDWGWTEVSEKLVGKFVLAHYSSKTLWESINDITKVTGSFSGSIIETDEDDAIFICQNSLNEEEPGILVREKS
tara:strand:+ start:1279 stop:1719 length:441 start_codon:yes stop_codon:yes gene_type:complete